MTYQLKQHDMNRSDGLPQEKARRRLEGVACAAAVSVHMPGDAAAAGVPSLADKGTLSGGQGARGGGKSPFYLELDRAGAFNLDYLLGEFASSVCEGAFRRLGLLPGRALCALYPDSWAARGIRSLGTDCFDPESDRATGFHFASSDMMAVLSALSTGSRIYFEPAAMPPAVIPDRGATGLNEPAAPICRAFLDALAADRIAGSLASLDALAAVLSQMDGSYFGWAHWEDNDSVAATELERMFDDVERRQRDPMQATKHAWRKPARLARRLDSHALVQMEVEARWNGVDGKGDVESKAATQAERDSWTPAEAARHEAQGQPWKARD